MDSLIFTLVCENVDDIDFMFPFLRLICKDFRDVIDDYTHLSKRYKHCLQNNHQWFKNITLYSDLLIFTLNNLNTFKPDHLNYLLKSGGHDHPIAWKIINSRPDVDFTISSLIPFVKYYSCLKPNNTLYKFLLSNKPWSFRSTTFKTKFLRMVVLREKFELLRPNFFPHNEDHAILMHDLYGMSSSIFDDVENLRHYITILNFYRSRVDRNLDHYRIHLPSIKKLLKRGVFDVADYIMRTYQHDLTDYPKQELMSKILNGCQKNPEEGINFIEKNLTSFQTTFNSEHFKLVQEINDDRLSKWYDKATPFFATL